MKWLYYPGRLYQPTDYLFIPSYLSISALGTLVDVTWGRIYHLTGGRNPFPLNFGVMASVPGRFL